VLFVDDRLMTDLTSIGTLFAFVLVSGGVLLLPRIGKQPGKFSLPYVNGKWIIPALYLMFTWAFHERLQASFAQLGHEGSQETLFLFFIILAGLMAVMTFIRNYSLIPVLGVLCCMYLMIEIPTKSWLVFFGWMAVGLLIYFLYGKGHSRLAKEGR
jgi:hypothetical protein